ncbi:hypothetical protein RUND412_007589 [Rhizina undulata]
MARSVWGVVECIEFEDVEVNGMRDEVFSNVCQGLKTKGPAVDLELETTNSASIYNSSRRSKSILHSTDNSSAPSKVSAGAGKSTTTKRKPKVQQGSSSKKQKTLDATDDTVNKRIHTRIFLSTVGRPIHKFASICELLEAFRDAIKDMFYKNLNI